MKNATGILLIIVLAAAVVWAGGRDANDTAPADAPKLDIEKDGPKATGGPPPPRAMRRRWRHKNLTDEQEAEFLAALKKNRPFTYRMLQRLKEHNLDRYRGTLYRHWLDWQQLQRMPEKVRKAYTAIQQGRRAMVKLIVQYRSADDDEARKKITSQIRSLAAEIFDAHLVMREYKVAELEDRIKELRKELKELRQNRDDEIEKNVQKLLRRRGRQEGRGRGSDE
ncbi:MAG: hypothetical protein ACOCZU_02390 [Planctomycetota bacterium]